MGESGSGKSTLLHLVAGLDRVDGGSIRIGEQRLDQLNEGQLAHWRRTQIGLVFQQFNLIGSLRVEDNLAFQARLAGRFDPHWQAQLVERLGLGDLLRRYPEQLSGGQQQRVAVGRALASRPVCYWPMSPPATSTKPPAMKCCNCCWTCCETAPPAC